MITKEKFEEILDIARTYIVAFFPVEIKKDDNGRWMIGNVLDDDVFVSVGIDVDKSHLINEINDTDWNNILDDLKPIEGPYFLDVLFVRERDYDPEDLGKVYYYYNVEHVKLTFIGYTEEEESIKLDVSNIFNN